eukprot:TRINITY_DN60502_c0_g1_i1.p2 TRINITY_DN60502_c0_g1~~TRINITY_DN60502_c0_g1_i1.p2  ORF type:complete len:375 (+),score=98.58 TRINITY_DN60502_c0_g1_i1:84-1127(+)
MGAAGMGTDEDHVALRTQALERAMGLAERQRVGSTLDQAINAAVGLTLSLFCALSLLNVIPGVLTTVPLWFANFALMLFGILVTLYETPAPEFKLLYFMEGPVYRVRDGCDEWCRAFAIMWTRGILYADTGLLLMFAYGLVSTHGICGAAFVLMGILLLFNYWDNMREYRREYEVRVKELNREYLDKRRTFDRFATDGAVSYDDFVKLYYEIDKHKLGRRQMRKITRRLDVNNNGRIDWDEFIAWYVAAAPKAAPVPGICIAPGATQRIEQLLTARGENPDRRSETTQPPPRAPPASDPYAAAPGYGTLMFTERGAGAAQSSPRSIGDDDYQAVQAGAPEIYSSSPE